MRRSPNAPYPALPPDAVFRGLLAFACERAVHQTGEKLAAPQRGTEWPITMATNLQVNRVKINEDAVFCFHRRNEMLGLGLVGTIIVIVLIVWLVRRV
jgi:hypothetical protein